MKCDHCKRKYRGQKGYTAKDMNKGKIIVQACSISCLITKLSRLAENLCDTCRIRDSCSLAILHPTASNKTVTCDYCIPPKET